MKPLNELLEFSIINLDKPTGPTSYQVSDYVRERLGLNKTSHLGTLDPAVSGVLPIALNRACRLATYLMKKDKKYVGIMRLHEDIDVSLLRKHMKEFVGVITQLPPVRSAVKRAERTREVMAFELLEKDENDVLFRANVEAGTYIRTLVHDLGKKIGGAHMLELRRTEAGNFIEKEAHTLYEFDDAVGAWKNGDELPLRALLLPAEEIIKQAMPLLFIKEDNLKKILTGKPIHANDLLKNKIFEKGTYAGVFCKERFIEIVKVANEGEVIAVPDFVFN